MGSLVVLDYLLEKRRGLAGAIISGVATEPAGVGSPVAIAAAMVLSGVLPRFSVDLGRSVPAVAGLLHRGLQQLGRRLPQPD